LECKANKIQKNIKTHWISILSPSKHILNEYEAFVVKMAIDSASGQITEANYELLCDVETLLGLACVIPLLEVV
jgi:hypothetical protein